MTRQPRSVRLPRRRQNRRERLFERLETRALLSAIPPPAGLVSWWTGDESTDDLVGPNNGTLSNGATISTGYIGNGFEFTAASGYFRAPTANLPNGNRDRTVELWARIDQQVAGEAFFASYGVPGELNQVYALGTLSNGQLFASTWGPSIRGPALENNRWYHVAVTNNGNLFRLYLDGVQVAAGTMAVDTPANSSFWLGRQTTGSEGDSRRLDGMVDEVSVYNRALSAPEIYSIYNAGVEGKIKSASYVAADSPTVVEGPAGATAAMTFMLRRVGDLTGQVVVDWTTADATAVAGSDYVATSGQVVFADGESQKIATIEVYGDDLEELNETFDLVLTTATPGYAVAAGQASIRNDDVSISISDGTAFEGSTTLKMIDRFVAEGSGGLTTPRLSVIGPDANHDGVGELYVASGASNEILRYDGSNGAFLDTFVTARSGGLEGPADLEFGPDGMLYVSSLGAPDVQLGSGSVLRYNGLTGQFIDRIVEGLSRPLGLAFDGEGRLYIANQFGHNVMRYASDGLTEFVWAGSGGLSQPFGLTFGPDGNGDGRRDLYVASQVSGQVLRYDGESGEFLGTFAESPPGLPGSFSNRGPMGLEFGSDGYLYVTARSGADGLQTSIVRFKAASGAFVDSRSLNRDGWSFSIGLDDLIYSSSNASGNFIERFGYSSLATLTVSLSYPSALPVTVKYQTNNGTATSGNDYAAAAGTLTFSPGQTTQTVLVRTIIDKLAEGSETFTVSLSNPLGGSIRDGESTVTIEEGGNVGPSISISDANSIEGDDALKYLDRFVANGPGLILHSAFGPDGNGDGVGELYVTSQQSKEVLRYDGQNGALLDRFITGIDNPLDPQVGPDGNLYVISGREVRSYDTSTGDLIAIVAQSDFGLSNITFRSDGALYYSGWSGIYKNGERFISPGSGGLKTSVQIEFGPDANGDAIADLYVSSVDYDNLTNPGQILRYNGTTGAFIDVFARFNRGERGAMQGFGTDGYLYASVLVGSQSYLRRFDPTSRAIIDSIPVSSGAFIPERDGLTYISGWTSGNYVDRLGPGLLTALKVTLSEPSAVPVTVNYSTEDGTAIAGEDYVGVRGTLRFAAGQTSLTVLVKSIDNAMPELPESFSLRLSNAVGGTIVDGNAVGTILDDEPPTISISIDDVILVEGANVQASLSVRLTGPSTSPVTLSFATMDDSAYAGYDYLKLSGTLTFNPGEITKSIVVPILNDTGREPTKKFTVNLSNAVGAAITDATAVATIQDDDDEIQFTLRVSTDGLRLEEYVFNPPLPGAQPIATWPMSSPLPYVTDTDFLHSNDAVFIEFPAGSQGPLGGIHLQSGVGVNRLVVRSGSVLIESVSTGGVLNTSVEPGAELITSQLDQKHLTIAGGGRVTILPGARTSKLTGLNLDPGASLDIADNALVLDYTGASPLAAIRGSILAGRDGPGFGASWKGPGINSSAVAEANQVEPEAYSIAFAENSALPLGPYTDFRGIPVDDTSILIAYTRTGDANLDGLVNDDDVTIINATYAPGVRQPAWALGDFDYNGFVDDDDITLLGAFYNPATLFSFPSSTWERTAPQAPPTEQAGGVALPTGPAKINDYGLAVAELFADEASSALLRRTGSGLRTSF